MERSRRQAAWHQQGVWAKEQSRSADALPTSANRRALERRYPAGAVGLTQLLGRPVMRASSRPGSSGATTHDVTDPARFLEEPDQAASSRRARATTLSTVKP